jgi:hypothetical protein
MAGESHVAAHSAVEQRTKHVGIWNKEGTFLMLPSYFLDCLDRCRAMVGIRGLDRDCGTTKSYGRSMT